MPGLGRLSDLAASYAVHCHGCPAGVHNVIGPAVTGSPTVLVNSLPALRYRDLGVAVACCGPNTWIATTGSTTVFIDALPAHRQGDVVIHCSITLGNLIMGSPDVIVGG